MRLTFFPLTYAVAIIGAAAASPAFASTAIYKFTDGADGGFPQGGVVADAKGNFYGTTTSGGALQNGVVYELSPPAAGQTAWTQTTLHTFNGKVKGSDPQAGLLMGPNGDLYGTTYLGGAKGEGMVFRLTPHTVKKKTTWTEAVLLSFNGKKGGGNPSGTLSMDAAGNLYGTTLIGGTGVVGTVFELVAPAAGETAWTEKVLYNFTGNNDGGQPFGNVLIGLDGNLYGTTCGYGANSYGTIYRLNAPTGGSGSWSLTTLHAFAGGTDGEVPRDGLIQAASGTMYGTTAGFDTSYGTIFQINPDGSNYQVLYALTAPSLGASFNGPWQTVSLDSTTGALYGATLGDGESAYGEVFKLTPPVAPATKWSFIVMHVFGSNADGEFPYTRVLIQGSNIYGTSNGEAGEFGFYPGTVWSLPK